MSRQLLAGAWRLMRFEMHVADQVVLPFGDDGSGLLILTADGLLSAHIMRAQRSRFASSDVFGGTPAEVMEAFQGYIAFWGEYEVDEAARTMTYIVHGSLFPNWIGEQNVRHYRLEGPRLILTTEPMQLAGQTATGVLQWQRDEPVDPSQR